jgi:DNA repair exonuclease SbcCD ATPase subunit
MADVEKDIVLRVKSETSEAQKNIKGLADEQRELNRQLQELAKNGDTTSTTFIDTAEKLSKVKEEISKVNERVSALTKSSNKLASFANAVSLTASGFEIATGAANLFSNSNEDIEKSLKKIQSVMALTNGIREFSEALKSSAFASNLLAKAQSLFNKVLPATNIGMKALRATLVSLGIGAISIALGYLIENFDDVKKTILNLLKPFDGIIAKVRDFLSVISFGLIDDASTAKTKANAEESLKALEKVANYNKSQENVYQRQIELAKARGKSLEEVFALENKLLDFRLKNNYAEQDAIKRKIALNTATEDEKKKLYELVESARDTIKEKDLLEINYFKDKKERQKRIEEAEMLRRKNAYSEIEEIETIKLEIESLDEAKQKYYENSASSLLQDALYYKKVADEQAEDDKRRHEKKIERAKQWLDISSEGLSALMDLNEAFSKKDEASKKRAFERTKKLQIAQAIISTAQGVIGQLAVPQDQLSGINFAKAAIVLATGIAQVKKIQTTKYEGGGDALSSSLNAPDTSPSGGAMQTNTISSTQLQLDAQGNLKQQQVRTYVLETDISDKQKRSSRLQKTATFGR